MRFKSISIQNINGFKEAEIVFSKQINVLIGANNSGKSTILNAILLLQHQHLANINIREGSVNGKIRIAFEDPPKKLFETYNSDSRFPQYFKHIDLALERKTLSKTITRYNPDNKAERAFPFVDFPMVEPDNIIYPFLSKRKNGVYKEEINLSVINAITGNFENLYAKIDRLCNKYQDGHDLYNEYCTKILGYPISVIDTDKGKKAAYRFKTRHIPLTSMGEGVPNLLGLIVDLCYAESKVFIIEEIENDIHPQALKHLMELVIKKSQTNQFLISTHSNIVVRTLGSIDSTIFFNVAMNLDEDGIPKSTITLIGTELEDRLQVLYNLGYEFYDFGLWKGYLFLEESSAEEIIRGYLIPNFVKSLIPKLKTFSARSLDEVEPKFIDFTNFYLFLNQEPAYKNKAWVIVDSGSKESEVINKIKNRLVPKGWNEENFLQFTEHNFEKYYPMRFQDEVFAIFNEPNRKEKQNKKSQLLNKVKKWIDENPIDAEKEFEISANEVIKKLKIIEASLN